MRFEARGLPEGLALFEVAADADADGLRLTWSASGAEPRSATVPGPLLRRLVLGHEVDLTPSVPLSGLSPLPDELSASDVLLVREVPGGAIPPWESEQPPVAGDADPIRLAQALRRWWSADTVVADLPVAVGTSVSAVTHWSESPLPGKKPLLLIPAAALPPPLDDLQSSLLASWPVGPVAEDLPAKKLPGLVVLVSGEPPALLGQRVRTLARDPAMQDRLLAVFSLSGPLRADLPASLLAEGKLAGLGVAHTPPVNLPGWVSRLRGFADELKRSGGRVRVERIDGPFLWYF